MQKERNEIQKHYRKTNFVALILDPRHKLEGFDIKQWSRNIKSKALKYLRKFRKKNMLQKKIILKKIRLKQRRR